jgi:hypothetical protein
MVGMPTDGDGADADRMVDAMTTEFVDLSDTLRLDEATAQLGSAEFATVTDTDGALVTVLSADALQRIVEEYVEARDAARAGGDEASQGERLADVAEMFPPLLQVEPQVLFSDFAASAGVTLVGLGPDAVAVVDDDGMRGLITLNVLDGRLAEFKSSVTAQLLGPGDDAVTDAQLAGRISTGLARIVCRACQYINTLSYFDRRHPPLCQNPTGTRHALSVRAPGSFGFGVSTGFGSAEPPGTSGPSDPSGPSGPDGPDGSGIPTGFTGPATSPDPTS